MNFLKSLRKSPTRDRPGALSTTEAAEQTQTTAQSVHQYSDVAAATISFLLALVHGPTDKFVYDAAGYWAGANALVTGENFFWAGGLELRGAMTVLVYLPASLASLQFNGGHFIAVLVQNALLIAMLGTFVVPRIVGCLVRTSLKHTWVSAILCSLLLSGFAPYPLVDLWALTLVLLGIILALEGKSPWLLVLSGCAFAAAINLRPAYLVPVFLAGIAWMIFYCRRAHWPALGIFLGLIPQIITNGVFTGLWKPWPLSTSDISRIQAQYAPFTVRYDTVAYVPTPAPQQFSCSPVMAASLGDSKPEGTKDILGFFAETFPESVVFMAQKVAASLSWSLATPYSGLPSSHLNILAVLVVLVSVTGLLTMVQYSAVCQPKLAAAPLMLLAVWLGSVATIAGSTPEARFALPIVMIGVIGSVSLVAKLPDQLRFTTVTALWVGGAAVIVVMLLWLGNTGLSHPAPAGNVTAAACQ